jgi:hypothetical protein
MTMKTLCTLIAMLTCLSYGYSADFMTEIDQRAEQIIETSSIRDEDEKLLEFYADEVAKCDSDMLAKHPELVFRRAMAWSNTIDIDESLDQLQLVQKELAFVLEHAEKGSRLYDACAFQKSLVDQIFFAANPQDLETFFSVICQFLDNQLRRWAPGSTASGKELRQEVLANLNSSPDAMSSFCDFLLLAEDDPRISLGYIKPIQVTVTGLCEDEGPVTLDYEILYRTPHGSVSIEGGI